MNKLLETLPLSAPLHHAYLIAGDPGRLVSLLKEYLADRFGPNFVSSSNPDLILASYDLWGVDESRELKSYQSRRPIRFAAKVVIISCRSVTGEAQNSLLKTLEEPAPNTHFFILTRTAESFLPTIQSRCQLIDWPEETGSQVGERSGDFLRAGVALRLKMVKDVLADQEEDPAFGQNFINALLTAYWAKTKNDQETAKSLGAERLEEAVILAGQRGSSLRLLLEYLAEVLPMA